MTQTAPHILVIDDDARLRDLLSRFLQESGYLVSGAESAAQARAIMTGETGLELLADIRKTSHIPALFLTAMNETENRIDGLEVGADDYIAKPFEPRELILRIQRILDRQEQQTVIGLVRFGTFTFDCDSRILSEAGRRIHITTAEQDLLSCFAVAPNQVLSREDISRQLKGRMKGRSIDVAVARLRTKLEADPRFPVYLQTTRGKGWLLRTN